MGLKPIRLAEVFRIKIAPDKKVIKTFRSLSKSGQVSNKKNKIIILERKNCEEKLPKFAEQYLNVNRMTA